ncbi:MAG: alpha-L-fucosidase [Acidobacteriaceae bacterium]|nr:alpha-L-fucosidase [Acidobacteriaceae bacterium]
MHRREFFKTASLLAAPARIRGQDTGAAGQSAPGFNQWQQDYAHFCAMAPERRTFYVLRDGNIVSTKLDEANWKPTAWGEPSQLPVPGGSWDGVPMTAPVPGLHGDGPFQPTWESLLDYEAPEWYRDAKFGIWAHWSPQCVPEAGDWYARGMYLEGGRAYKYQLEHYGHPSNFGYKDLCAQWTLLNWQPEELIQRYKRAGAKIFIALANHHDGFDTWNSKQQPWNAVNLGPHRDVIGTWAKLARANGMRFGVTVHQGRNWWWFQPSHDADKKGPLTGVPYDGRLTATAGQSEWWQGYDPQQLYGVKHPFDALPDASYVKNFYDRTRDLVDQHGPDLLYFDNSRLPLGWAGMNIGAYFYNSNLRNRGGKMEAVLNGKNIPDNWAKAVVADYERGLTKEIMPYPWQSETCIGQWHYNRDLFEKPGEYGGYASPRDIVHWMIDAVSKNGTFILNIPGRPDGTLDAKEITFLDHLTAWMDVNGEAIFETRPCKIYGEGPNSVTSGSFKGESVSKLGPQDIRFTRNKANTVVYAIAFGWPTEPVVVKALGTSSSIAGKVANVEVLGVNGKVDWTQDPQGLRVTLPRNERPHTDYAASIKVRLA